MPLIKKQDTSWHTSGSSVSVQLGCYHEWTDFLTLMSTFL